MMVLLATRFLHFYLVDFAFSGFSGLRRIYFFAEMMPA